MDKKLEYLTPTLEAFDLGNDFVTTSREWDTEEMPIPTSETEQSRFVW